MPAFVALALTASVYVAGWLRLRSLRVISGWRAGSFLAGLLSIWTAVASPLAALDEQLLTIHMAQHLLLMTIAPPLILLGAPVMPLLRGLPRNVVKRTVSRVCHWRPFETIREIFGQPVVCWLAATAALVVWHIPAVFTPALRSEPLHMFEHASFLVSGLLFWWPVIQPWPARPHSSGWTMLLYLFLATLPCDVLSAFLVFSEKVAYPVYFLTAGKLRGVGFGRSAVRGRIDVDLRHGGLPRCGNDSERSHALHAGHRTWR